MRSVGARVRHQQRRHGVERLAQLAQAAAVARAHRERRAAGDVAEAQSNSAQLARSETVGLADDQQRGLVAAHAVERVQYRRQLQLRVRMRAVHNDGEKMCLTHLLEGSGERLDELRWK